MGPISNYPHGFKNGVTIRGVPVELAYPGKVFWVGNSATRLPNEKTASDGNDGTFLAPFSTIEGAMNSSQVVASRGDVIFVRPGHTLSVTTESTLALDKAGVAVIGLGSGASRPTITHTAPSGTILVTAANVAWRNFLHTVTGTHTVGLDGAFKVSAVDAAFEDCEFRDPATASTNFGLTIGLGGGANASANQADRVTVKNCVFRYVAAEGGTGTKSIPIGVEAVTDRITVDNCQMFTANPSGRGLVQIAASYNVTRLVIKDSVVLATALSGTAGTLGAFVSGGGTGDTGSGGSGIITRSTAMVGTTLSNNRFVGIDAVTSLMLDNQTVINGGFHGGATLTASRHINVASLTSQTQSS